MKRLLARSFFAALILSSLYKVADAKSTSRADQMANGQFIEMTYTSLCQRQPDPASFDYYARQLNEGNWTTSDVRNMIQLSCSQTKSDTVCEHVRGLDLCKPS